MTPFIVAEVSKNWINGVSPSPLLLAELFELVIERNRQRGYRLHSFQLHRLMSREDEMNETIIAVFEQVESPMSVDAVDPHVADPGTPTTRVKGSSSSSS